MAFKVIKKLDLSYLGEGWANGTFLRFSSLTFAETREFANLDVDPENPESATNMDNLDKVLEIVQKHYIDGSGYDGEKVVPIEATDLPNLPVDVITKSIELLAGTADPKSSAA